MNTPDHDSPIPADEWQAQEQAMRAERGQRARIGRHAHERVSPHCPRSGPAAAGDSAAGLRATGGAAGHARKRRDTDTRIENGLATALMAVLGLAVLVLAVLQGPQWWQALTSLVPDATLSNRWLLSLLACAAVTFVLGRAGDRRTFLR